MELDLIEMVAYRCLHTASEDAWRCAVCPSEHKFTRETITPHVLTHGHDAAKLREEPSGEIFLHP